MKQYLKTGIINLLVMLTLVFHLSVAVYASQDTELFDSGNENQIVLKEELSDDSDRLDSIFSSDEDTTISFFSDDETVSDECSEWEGNGTESEPYLLKTTEDLETLSWQVNEEGRSFAGTYFKMAADIVLPENWIPIGTSTCRFEGTFNGGGYLLTIPAGEKCLLGYVRRAVLSDLNIYGPEIASAGVVETYTVDMDDVPTIHIERVTLKSGTRTLESGFIGGYASGTNEVTILDCAVEAGVVIGYDRTKSNIGSFGGDFNGTIKGCISSAAVYGVNYVGGISGSKGQSVGTYCIEDCTFNGSVSASGRYVGGISGGGYGGTKWGVDTAPNTGAATIINCLVSGCVAGDDYVGGILGAETGIVQCWDNGIGYIQNNTFNGSLSASSGTYTGGIIGYLNGIDKYNIIENNVFFGKDLKGIGFIRYIDTNYPEPAAVSGVTYFCTETGNKKGGVSGASLSDHNRTDDPLGADADKLAKHGQISVTFTLLGDKKHDSDADKNYHTLVGGNLETWIPESEYAVDENATVFDVLRKVLGENGMDMKVDNTKYGIYIRGIRKDKNDPDSLLEEFDNGPCSGWMYTVNGVAPKVGAAAREVTNGDAIIFYYTDEYTREHIHKWQSTWSSDENGHWHACEDAFCYITDRKENDGYEAHKYQEIKSVPATCTAAREKRYICTVCGKEKEEKIPMSSHTPGTWKVVKKATALATGLKEQKCMKCGKVLATEKIAKLTPTIKLNVGTKIQLKVGQSTTAVKVSGLAAGDSIASWASSNKKVAVVYSSGKITAKAKGTAKITITLKSKKTASFYVTVTATAVKTTRITGLSATLKLNKGKTAALKPARYPITSVEKITYATSNKNVATVNSKGLVRAVGKGTANITVKAGNAKYTVKVTVPMTRTLSITGVKSSLNLKRGYTYTLKPRLYPTGSDEKISYSTSNKSVARVNSKGIIKGVKKGTAVITVKSGSKCVTCKIIVT